MSHQRPPQAPLQLQFFVGNSLRLEFSDLAKPAQRKLNLRGFDFVVAKEWFDTNACEAGVHQRSADVLVRARWSDRVIHSAAEPDRDVKKIGRRAIRFVSEAQSIVVDSGQEKSANFHRTALCQHCAENTAAFRASGKSCERNRPLR